MGYNVNEIYKGSSDHLKSEDIGNEMPTYTIAGVDQKQFDNGDVKLIVGFHETDKSLVLNATNARAIGDMYTPNTDNWPGNRIMLFTMPTEFNGQKMLGLRVRAPADGTTVPNQAAANVQAAVDNGAFNQTDPRGDVPPATDPNAYGATRG